MWTVKFRNGNVKRFKFPIRTTPEGSIKPFEGKPAPANLEDGILFTQTTLPGAPQDGMSKKFDVQDPGKAATYMEHGR
jgi:adenylylsulfate reductase subunit B